VDVPNLVYDPNRAGVEVSSARLFVFCVKRMVGWEVVLGGGVGGALPKNKKIKKNFD
jgi:hypothetical protein